jgi:hypothetical protein
VSTNIERSPDAREAIMLHDDGGLELSSTTELAINSLVESAATQPACEATDESASLNTITLAQLQPGARLILRCRKDWRAASVAAIEPDCVRLNVASPTGHTYRVRRPHDSPLAFDGAIPILSDRHSANWRVTLARYDARW